MFNFSTSNVRRDLAVWVRCFAAEFPAFRPGCSAPAFIQFAEVTVAVTVGFLLPVLFPDPLQRQLPRAPKLVADVGEVRQARPRLRQSTLIGIKRIARLTRGIPCGRATNDLMGRYRSHWRAAMRAALRLTNIGACYAIFSAQHELIRTRGTFHRAPRVVSRFK